MRPLLPELLPAEIKRTLRSPWLHPLNDLQAVDELLERVNPMWALGRIRARVIEVRSETPDTKTFVLKICALFILLAALCATVTPVTVCTH